MELHRDMTAPGAARAADLIDASRVVPKFVGRRAPSGYVPEIDALRAIAMTSVIFIHCRLMPFGWMGVWLFFVVSGFAVTTSLFGGRPAPTVSRAISGFYLRRGLRIWPVYYAFIALNVLAMLAIGRTEPLEDLPSLLTFTFNIKMIFKHYTPLNEWGGFSQLWTLSVEQQFYLVFPLLLLLRNRTARARALLGVIVLAPLIRLAVGHWMSASGWDAERSAFGVYAFGPTQFDAFAVGALIALFRTEIAGNSRMARVSLVLAAVGTIVYVSVYAAIGVALNGVSLDSLRNIVSGIAYGQGREVFVYMVPTWLGAAVLIGILAGRPYALRICRVPGLQAIGRISYGGYLFHSPVLMVLVSTVPMFTDGPATSWPGIVHHVALFACAYPITLGAAWLSFRYFEQPISRFGRRFA